MKAFLLVFVLISVMVPQVSASPNQRPEINSSIEAPRIVQAAPIKPIELEPATPLELLYTHLPNPCIHGCGYERGQCTRYAALVREEMGYPVGDNWGNARNWVAAAQAAGVSTGPTPQSGAVAVNTGGTYGHVMVVRDVYPNGSFLITEANYDWLGSIRDRIVSSSDGLVFIYQ